MQYKRECLPILSKILDKLTAILNVQSIKKAEAHIVLKKRQSIPIGMVPILSTQLSISSRSNAEGQASSVLTS